MKWKLKYSEFDNITGKSCVIISTILGDFKATSKLHQEDKDIQSEFFGCRIAEMKAVEKYLKALIREKKKTIKVLTNIIDAVNQLKFHNEKSAEYIFINKQKNIEEKELEKIICRKNSLNKQIIEEIKNYRPAHTNFLKQLQKNREKRNQKTEEEIEVL